MIENRVVGLDVFRGWAILLMTAYHFSYNLNYFGYIHVDLDRDLFFIFERYAIVTMFLFSVGISLYLAYTPDIKYPKILKRTAILGTASLLVSIVTYWQFPHTWVYFGILHFVLVASWVGLIFLPYPTIALMTAMIILLGSLFGWIGTHGLFELLKAPLHLPIRYTEDLVRFFPWFGVVLLAISVAGYGIHQKLFAFQFFSSDNRFNTLLALLGRHALLIYLIHLPLLFGLFMLWQ